MNDHATRICQPSASKRTFNCSGWGNLCKDIPPKPSSVYAAEGSVAHFLGEQCLIHDQDADHALNWEFVYHKGDVYRKGAHVEPDNKSDYFEFVANEEMVEAVQVYIDEVRRKRKAVVGGIFKIEQKLDLNWMVPGMWGKGDSVIVEPLGCMYVDDLKYGKGVAVDVLDNTQLMIYGLGALGEGNPHMVEEVEITICQPRAIHKDGPVRSVRYSVDNLLEWGEKVLKPAIDKARTSNELNHGDWCKWCDGQEICPKIREEMFGVIEEEPTKDLVPVANDITLPEPALLNSDKMNRILQFIDIAQDWFKNVKEEGYRRLEKGDEDAPTIVKLVEGRLGNRAYSSDDDNVHNALKTVLSRADIFAPSKVKSPAQMENALKKAGFKPKERKEIIDPLLKERTPGKPVMVPVNDSRPALPPAVEIMFGEDDDVLDI